MIRYDLKCSEGHSFDSWFSSANDFDKLVRAGMLVCSVCGTADVKKAVMTPQVTGTSERSATITTTGLRQKIEASADNVGKEFAKEARKIHEGEAPERAIYGEARIEEAKSLVEDGIPVVPLPWNARKLN